MRMYELDTFTRAYIEAMLWSTTDESTGDHFDNDYEAADFVPESMADIVEECQWFQEEYGHYFEGMEREAGHDFWLTREGHGCGFWDGDWEDPAATELTDACKKHFRENAEVWAENDNLYYHSCALDRHREELKRAKWPVINTTRPIHLGDL